MDAKDGRTPVVNSSKQNQKTILRNLNMHNSMGMGMEHATHGDHQAAVELPTLFATVSSDGQHIRLEKMFLCEGSCALFRAALSLLSRRS